MHYVKRRSPAIFAKKMLAPVVDIKIAVSIGLDQESSVASGGRQEVSQVTELRLLVTAVVI